MSDETWLTDEQQRVWRQYLKVSRGIAERIEGDMQRQAGIPSAYYLILAMLSEAPGRALRMNQLAEVLNSSQSRTSHAIARLEEQGLVCRERAPLDGRGQVARLTEAGWDQVVELAPGHVRTVRSVMFEPLDPDESAALGRALDKIDARLAAGPNAFVSQRLVPVE